MPYIITDTRDAKNGSVLTFGAGTTANTTGTQTLTAGTYEYTEFTLNSGQTLTVAHNVIIKCTGTFTLNAGAIITYQDYTGTPIYTATNGYYETNGSSRRFINGGGGAGSSRSAGPSQFADNPPYSPVSTDIEQQRIGPYDYHSYSAISNTGPSNVVTTSNAPVSINDALSNNMAGGRGGNGGGAPSGTGGYGKGAMKIMANRVVINGTVNAIGNDQSGGANEHYGGCGGGGFLWVVTGTFSGTGAINCISPSGLGTMGGHGRFRLDYCFGTPSVWNSVGNLQTSNSVLTNYKSLTFVGGGAIGF
jgi:hypothetical protein